MVHPGHGISLFIKQMLIEGLIHLGTQGAAARRQRPNRERGRERVHL
jgi:hypothetical protein